MNQTLVFKPRSGKAHIVKVDANGRIKRSRSICGTKVFDDWRMVKNVDELGSAEKCAKCFD